VGQQEKERWNGTLEKKGRKGKERLQLKAKRQEIHPLLLKEEEGR